MKKQLLLVAIVGGSLAVAAPQVQAQIGTPVTGNPLTSQQIQNAALAATGVGPGGATIITVSGTIDQSITFTKVDNILELGNIGGPNAIGVQTSVGGRRSAGTTGAFTGTAPVNDTGNGYAEIEFVSNTDIKVEFAGDDIVGGTSSVNANTLNGNGRAGASGANANHILPTAYRVATKGKVTFSDGFYQNGPSNGGTGQNPTNPGAYTSYTPGAFEAGTGTPATGSGTLAQMTLIFGAGGPSGTGAQGGTGTPNASGPNAPSGFLVLAEITRAGTNDPAGTYTGTLNMTYSKF